jgi:hypothetical protein
VPDIFCSTLTKSGFSGQIFAEIPVSNFTEVGPVGGYTVTCGQTEDGRTDAMKLIGGFRDLCECV